MTPLDVIHELLLRIGSNQGVGVLITETELSQWPAAAVNALRHQKLLLKSSPSKSVVCPGCEQQCVMPVHTLSRDTPGAKSFVVCDKRDDTNRVPIAEQHLKQWRCNEDCICNFVAESLGIRRGQKQAHDLREIGVFAGNKRSQMVCLDVKNEVKLVIGSNTLPFIDCIKYSEDQYAVNSERIVCMVDAATTIDSRYTPSSSKRETRKQETQAMYINWQKEYRKLVRAKPGKSDVWYAQQIARTLAGLGRSADTIKKKMTSLALQPRQHS